MKPKSSSKLQSLIRENLRTAKQLYSDDLTRWRVSTLRHLTRNFNLSLKLGDLQLLSGGWYVTHVGLIRMAAHNRCFGIGVQPEREFCDSIKNRWIFKATVYRSRTCKGFVGYGDADPSNVSSLVHGAEMRVAETRAVNRALRKAYGIGICSVEEIGSFAEPTPSSKESKKHPPQAVNGKNGNYGGPKVRDRLCQLIRQHELDANLVKSYAVDFCGTKTLREATREQVEGFVTHLAGWAEKDRNALLCQLNSYLANKEGAA
jgi:hypothetical protein